MLKPWRPAGPVTLEHVDLDTLADSTQNLLLGYTIEFVSLGYVPVGDYLVRYEGDQQTVRYFQSDDGAVLGWIAQGDQTEAACGFASILQDGTCVRSTPDHPADPWSCCRFPVYVNFGAGCGLEELLVTHLTSLIELEHGCGSTTRYDAAHVPDVVSYMLVLMHETRHGLDAPPEALPTRPAGVVRESVLL